MTSNYDFKLYYFGIAGKGEEIRWAFHYLGIPFEDYRFTFKEFQELKASGTLPFGQVPVLKVTNKETGQETLLCQTVAIMRFIAKIGGQQENNKKSSFYPSCPIAAAKVDAILDQEADAYQSFRAMNYKDRFGFKEMSEEDQQKYKEVINQEVIPAHYEKLSSLINNGGTGWLAGTEGPSLADFHWVSTLMACQRGWTGKEARLTKELEALVEKFLAVPEIADYYKNNEFKIWWKN